MRRIILAVPNFNTVKSLYLKLQNILFTKALAYKSILQGLIVFTKKFGLYFIPSVILILSGVSSYFDKSLLPSMISVAICALGVLAVLITYKFLVVYTMEKDVMSKVDTHVVFQSRNQAAVPTQILDLLDDEEVDPSGQGYH